MHGHKQKRESEKPMSNQTPASCNIIKNANVSNEQRLQIDLLANTSGAMPVGKVFLKHDTLI